MNIFKIDNINCKKKFIFKTPTSSIRIKNITFQDYATIDLLSFIANTKIKITLREIIYQGDKFMDDRMIDFQLNIQAEPHQK